MAILFRKLPELEMETSVRLERETREKVISEVREMYRKSPMTVSWDRFYQEHCEPVWGKYMKLEEEERERIKMEKSIKELTKKEKYILTASYIGGIILLLVLFYLAIRLFLLIAEYGLLAVIGVPIWLFCMVFGHLTGHGKN